MVDQLGAVEGRAGHAVVGQVVGDPGPTVVPVVERQEAVGASAVQPALVGACGLLVTPQVFVATPVGMVWPPVCGSMVM